MPTEPTVTVWRNKIPHRCTLLYGGRKWRFIERGTPYRRLIDLRRMHVWSAHSPVIGGENPRLRQQGSIRLARDRVLPRGRNTTHPRRTHGGTRHMSNQGTTCGHCGRPAQLFLCEPCIRELKEMLVWLEHGRRRRGGAGQRHEAGFLDHLSEAALGQTKLGESARRTPRYRRRLDGDKSLASQIEAFPNDNEEDVGKARRQRQRAALQHALGSARINLRASEKVDETRAVLFEWVRSVCEARGTEMPFRTSGQTVTDGEILDTIDVPEDERPEVLARLREWARNAQPSAAAYALQALHIWRRVQAEAQQPGEEP